MAFQSLVLALYSLALALYMGVEPLETGLVVKIQCRAVAVALAEFQIVAKPSAEIQYLEGKAAQSACLHVMAGQWGHKEEV